jgi:hypothetical protein
LEDIRTRPVEWHVPYAVPIALSVLLVLSWA